MSGVRPNPLIFVRYNPEGAIAPSTLPPLPTPEAPYTQYRYFKLPEDDKVQSLVDGAISALFDAQYFAVRSDTVTDEEAAQYFRDILAGVMSNFCNDVLACIEANAARVALAVGGRGAAGSTGAIVTTEIAANDVNILANLQDCSTAKLKIIASWIVQDLCTVTNDGYETIEAATNYIEALAAAIDMLPVTASNTVSGAIEFVDKVQEFLQENFLAGETLANKSELAYQLVCYMQENNCSLSFNGLLEVTNSFLPTSLIGLAAGAVLVELYETTTANAAFYSSLASAVALMGLGNSWGGLLGADYFTALIQAHFDDLQPAFELPLDPECFINYEEIYEPKNDNRMGWLFNQVYWDSPSSPPYSAIANGINQIDAYHDYSGFDGLQHVIVEGEYSGTGFLPSVRVIVESGLSTLYDSTSLLNNVAGLWLVDFTTQNLQNVTRVRVLNVANSVGGNGSSAVYKITLKGYGGSLP